MKLFTKKNHITVVHFRRDILNYLLNSSTYDPGIAPDYEEGSFIYWCVLVKGGPLSTFNKTFNIAIGKCFFFKIS